MKTLEEESDVAKTTFKKLTPIWNSYHLYKKDLIPSYLISNSLCALLYGSETWKKEKK